MFFACEPDEILTWHVAFHSATPPTWWLRAVIRGRFTHVSAFAFSASTRTWLFIDPNMHMTRILLVPEGEAADKVLAQVMVGASIIKISRRNGEAFRFRPLFCCTSAIRHLLNLGGGKGFSALSVDSLWRDCLANGAEIVTNEAAPP